MSDDAPVSGARWLPCEDEYLAGRYLADSVAALAVALGRTPAAVVKRRRDISAAPKWRRWTPAEDALLCADGASPAPVPGRTAEACAHRRQVLRRRGVRAPRFNKDWPDEHLRQALAMSAAGMTRERIGEALGYSRSAVCRRLWAHKHEKALLEGASSRA